MWENAFLVTCAFLGDDVDRALAHLSPSAHERLAPSARVLRSASKLDRARLIASEVDAVKRALVALEDPWR